jgi:hypothetical protein
MRGPGGGTVNARYQDLSFLVGAGSVYSTARDLYSLMNAVRSGKLGPGPQQSFVDESGLDWNGVTNAFRAFADWHSDSDVSVVFVGNLQTGAGNRIRRDVHKIAAGETVPAPELPEIEPVQVPMETLRSWEGLYQLRPGSNLHVTARDGALLANDWVLVPTGARRFWSPQDYAFVDVVVDESGRPVRLDWEVDGEPLACPRLGDLKPQ